MIPRLHSSIRIDDRGKIPARLSHEALGELGRFSTVGKHSVKANARGSVIVDQLCDQRAMRVAARAMTANEEQDGRTCAESDAGFGTTNNAT